MVFATVVVVLCRRVNVRVRVNGFGNWVRGIGYGSRLPHRQSVGATCDLSLEIG